MVTTALGFVREKKGAHGAAIGRSLPLIDSKSKVGDAHALEGALTKGQGLTDLMGSMAQFDTHYGDRQKATRAPKRSGKWSGRASIGFALVASGILWATLYFTVKALIG
jgi:hypothetical protein